MKNNHTNRKTFLRDALLLGIGVWLLLFLLSCSMADRQSAVHGTSVTAASAITAGAIGGPIAGAATGIAAATTYALIPSGKEAAALEAVQETVEALGRDEVVSLVDGRVKGMSSNFGGTWFWIGLLTVFVLWRTRVGTDVKRRIQEVEEWFTEENE